MSWRVRRSSSLVFSAFWFLSSRASPFEKLDSHEFLGLGTAMMDAQPLGRSTVEVLARCSRSARERESPWCGRRCRRQRAEDHRPLSERGSHSHRVLIAT